MPENTITATPTVARETRRETLPSESGVLQIASTIFNIANHTVDHLRFAVTAISTAARSRSSADAPPVNPALRAPQSPAQTPRRLAPESTVRHPLVPAAMLLGSETFMFTYDGYLIDGRSLIPDTAADEPFRVVNPREVPPPANTEPLAVSSGSQVSRIKPKDLERARVARTALLDSENKIVHGLAEELRQLDCETFLNRRYDLETFRKRQDALLERIDTENDDPTSGIASADYVALMDDISMQYAEAERVFASNASTTTRAQGTPQLQAGQISPDITLLRF